MFPSSLRRKRRRKECSWTKREREFCTLPFPFLLPRSFGPPTLQAGPTQTDAAALSPPKGGEKRPAWAKERGRRGYKRKETDSPAFLQGQGLIYTGVQYREADTWTETLRISYRAQSLHILLVLLRSLMGKSWRGLKVK